MMDYKRQKVSTIHFWLARMYQFSGSHAESLGFKIWIMHATGNIFLFCKLFTLGSYFHYMEIFLFLDFTKILSVQNFSLARSFASIWPCHDPFANQVLSEISKLPILSVEQLSKLSMTNRLHTVPNVRTNKKKPKKKKTPKTFLLGEHAFVQNAGFDSPVSDLPIRITGLTPELFSRFSGTITVSPARMGWGCKIPVNMDWGTGTDKRGSIK